MDLDKIKERRKELGLTQFDLAKKVGVSDVTVRMWESGVREPSEENREALEAVLEDGEN